MIVKAVAEITNKDVSMNKSSSNLLVFLLAAIGAVVVLLIGFIRTEFFSSSPVDVYNVIIGFTAIFLIFVAARAMARNDT